MIFDEVAARYPDLFPLVAPPEQPAHADGPEPEPFAAVHQRIDEVAELAHRHLNFLEDITMITPPTSEDGT